MCVASTAKRRRRQMKLDRRFRVRGSGASARQLERVKANEARMQRGKKR